MGGYGGFGDGTGRAGAASIETPAATPYGRSQETFGCRLPAGSDAPASGAGKVQAVSRQGPADHLSRIRPRGRPGLKAATANRAPHAAQARADVDARSLVGRARRGRGSLRPMGTLEH